jgi:hypothetical protein
MTKKTKEDGTQKTRLIISAARDNYETFRAVFNLCNQKSIEFACDFYGIDKSMAKSHICRRLYGVAQKSDVEIMQSDH